MITPSIMALIFLTLTFGFSGPISAICAIMCILSVLDASGRYKEYEYHHEALLGGYVPLQVLIRACKTSHCQRQSLILAAQKLGIGDRVREIYYDMGYRWWNIAPDWLFSKPQTLLTRRFWKIFFRWGF